MERKGAREEIIPFNIIFFIVLEEVSQTNKLSSIGLKWIANGVYICASPVSGLAKVVT
jgi:hypothetical protein